MTTDLLGPALICDARRGSALARRQLIAVWSRTVLQWCLRLGGPNIDAHAAATDVLRFALANLQHISVTKPCLPWLFQITRRVIRRHRRHAWIAQLFPLWRTERACESQHTLTSPTAHRFVCALEALNSRQRELVVLALVERRSIDEIATLLNRTSTTLVRKHTKAIHRFEIQARRLGLPPDPPVLLHRVP